MALTDRAKFVVRGYARIKNDEERKAIREAIRAIDLKQTWDDEKEILEDISESLGTRIKAARLGPTGTACTCCGK